MGSNDALHVLLADMRRDGWRLRTTSKGHHRCLAPDGTTSVTVSGSPSDPRSLRNSRAVYRRWKGETMTATAAEPRTRTCDECGDEFGLAEDYHAYSAHKARHALVRRRTALNGKRIDCQFCGKEFTAVGLSTHIGRAHKGVTPDITTTFAEAIAEIADLPDLPVAEVEVIPDPEVEKEPEIDRLLNDVDTALELLSTAWAALRPLVERSREADAIEQIKQILGVR